MNTARHLLPEDRPEFERLLDEALRRTHPGAGDPSIGTRGPGRVDVENLRRTARDAAPLITAVAAVEYGRLLDARARGAAARPADGAPPTPSGARSGANEGTTGAGLGAVVSVLLPLLAGIAAAIFLTLGHVLGLMDPEPAAAGTIRAAGWFFLVLMGLGILVAGTELLITALRHGSGRSETGAGGAESRPREEESEEVTRARDAWEEALLERGLLPFLRDTAEESPATTDPSDPSGPGAPPARREGPGGRTPRLSYSSPGFAGPNEGRTGRERGRGYDSPGYDHPGFSSPRFTGPSEGGAGDRE
ncbi:membrane protein [Streptomyces calidiresistens]